MGGTRPNLYVAIGTTNTGAYIESVTIERKQNSMGSLRLGLRDPTNNIAWQQKSGSTVSVWESKAGDPWTYGAGTALFRGYIETVKLASQTIRDKTVSLSARDRMLEFARTYLLGSTHRYGWRYEPPYQYGTGNGTTTQYYLGTSTTHTRLKEFSERLYIDGTTLAHTMPVTRYTIDYACGSTYISPPPASGSTLHARYWRYVGTAVSATIRSICDAVGMAHDGTTIPDILNKRACDANGMTALDALGKAMDMIGTATSVGWYYDPANDKFNLRAPAASGVSLTREDGLRNNQTTYEGRDTINHLVLCYANDRSIYEVGTGGKKTLVLHDNDCSHLEEAAQKATSLYKQYSVDKRSGDCTLYDWRPTLMPSQTVTITDAYMGQTGGAEQINAITLSWDIGGRLPRTAIGYDSPRASVVDALRQARTGPSDYKEEATPFGPSSSESMMSAHNSLSGVQGGTTGERYHATADQADGLLSSEDKTGLTEGGGTELHTHGHNSLLGIQGGSAGERYHATAAQAAGFAPLTRYAWTPAAINSGLGATLNDGVNTTISFLIHLPHYSSGNPSIRVWLWPNNAGDIVLHATIVKIEHGFGLSDTSGSNEVHTVAGSNVFSRHVMSQTIPGSYVVQDIVWVDITRKGGLASDTINADVKLLGIQVFYVASA